MFLTTFQCDCERYFVFIVLNFIKICFVAKYMVYPEDVPYAPEEKYMYSAIGWSVLYIVC